MQEVVKWLEAHQIPCFYKHFLGVPCPTCGIQTSIILLLKGQLQQSFTTFPPLFFILCFIAYAILYLVFNFNNGASYLRKSAIFVGVVLGINYLSQLI